VARRLDLARGLVSSVSLVGLVGGASAHAAPVPGDEDRRDVHVLRRSADDAVRALAPRFSESEPAASRLVGAYVALDPSVTEATALAACDDDGDPVVMITQAFFELMASLADTAVADVAAPHDAHARVAATYPRLPRVEAYAALLAAQTQSAAPERARPVEPAPGTFTGPSGAASAELEGRLYDAMIESVVAVELAHLARGDVLCAHPTPTREAADADWSPAEAAAAREMALLPARDGAALQQRAIDAEILAASVMARARAPRDGALVVHRFLAAVEAHDAHRNAVPYLATHPLEALAFEAFRASWHAASDTTGAAPAAPSPPAHGTGHPAPPHRRFP
jgi:hypothetical protein